jgi:DNA repair protein RecO (recombination protein O)
MRLQDLATLVVHVRPYRESSALVQFFTREQGRLVGVMKGLHRGRRPQHVQPFQVGRLSCSGKTGLFTVTGFEMVDRIDLSGDALSAGFYVLELITRGLAERQAEPGVFDATLAALHALSVQDDFAPCLRRFESSLLTQLGYGLDYRHASDTGAPIAADGIYHLIEEQGFVRVEGDAAAASDAVPGWVLLAIAAGDFSRTRVRHTAKRLNQQALAPLIGSAPLISRSMYIGRSRG